MGGPTVIDRSAGVEAAASNGRLSPRFICRVAGLPARCLEELEAVRSIEAWHRLAEFEAELGEARESLATALFEVVGGLEDKQRRTALLRLKRDVHNLRPLKESCLAAVAGRASSGLVRGLEGYSALLARREDALERFREVFEEESAELRRRFQRSVTDEDFRKGLLLSSRTLFDETGRYLRAPADRPRAKERQVERSLMRYFSRTAMKATPFGTLCAIVAGRVDEQAAAEGFAGDPRRKRSRPRLNKTFYAFLRRHLESRPEVRRRLHVELNPTLHLDDTRWVFLTADKSREVFQRLAPNPVLDLLRETLRERGPLPLAALVETFLEHVDSTEEKATAYVERLLEIGFLRFRFGIREQEVDWDRPLREVLSAIDDRDARRIVEFLESYRHMVDGYAEVPVGERREHLETLTRLVGSLFEELGTEPRPPAGLPPLYEDTGAEASLTLGLGDLEGLVSEYVDLTSPLAWMRGEQANMRHFFESWYGDGTRSVPLLRFYEDYHREHFKDHLERREQGKKPGQAPRAEEAGQEPEDREKAPAAEDYDLTNPFGLEVVAAIEAARKRLGERIRELWRADPEAVELVLERRDFEEATAGLPPLGEPCNSVSLFVQYLPGFAPEGGDALVANVWQGGFGKYFSRFLYLLPEDVEDALRASNRRLTDDELAEICGDASFNANLHPPLLPREISYPTGEEGIAEEQIRTSDLAVEPDPERPHRLRLRHAVSGKEVVPVDLGFLNPRMRPPLYQLLGRLAPAAAFSLSMPETAEVPSRNQSEAALPESASVRYRPRVSYRGRLILARRQWMVPAALFPARRGSENEADYFLRVRRWREELGLPEEGFVRVHPLPASGPARKKKASRVRQHLYKPQYVDFRNPFLVDLFSRTAESLENFRVTLEERLPAREHLVPGGGERFATELILQMDFPARGEGGHGTA